MHDLLDDIDRWRRAGHRIAVARVVDIEGSGPRDPGAAMAVTDDGEVAGSVSGGCVEGAVVAEALSIIEGERQPGRTAADNQKICISCLHRFQPTVLRRFLPSVRPDANT